MFNRQGYDHTSVGDLAAELGLTKSAIYHHVPSKEHLLAQALDEALTGLTAVVDNAEQDPAVSAYERLRGVVERSVEVLLQHQPAVTLLLRVRGNSEVEQHALASRRTIDARLAALVREAIDEGSIRSDLPPELVSRLLFGMINSTVEWLRPGGAWSGELSQTIAAIAFDGLLCRDAE